MNKAKRRQKSRLDLRSRVRYRKHPKKWPTGGALHVSHGHVTTKKGAGMFEEGSSVGEKIRDVVSMTPWGGAVRVLSDMFIPSSGVAEVLSDAERAKLFYS